MSPLHEKLDQVEWGEWRLGDLFEVNSSKKKFDANKVEILSNGSYPYIVRTGLNNGRKGFLSEDISFLNEGNTISFGQDTATMFYQEMPYFTGDKIKILKPKYAKFNKANSQFFILAISKAFSSFSWGTSSFNVSIIENQNISLPTKNGEIDFAFMEHFIGDVENEYITDLESDHKLELHAYLSVTGFADYELTQEEQRVLEEFESGKFTWKDFRIEDVLQWQSQKEIDPLKLENLKDETENMYPFYGQSTTNNGIISHNQLTRKVLNNEHGKPTILIHSNNQNTVYLETPFYLKDGHGATSVLQSDFLNKMTAQFLMSSIKKVVLIKYSYNAKATKIELKNTIISLPILNNQPDYNLMQTLISAVQKVVIRDVVRYVERKMEVVRKVVE